MKKLKIAIFTLILSIYCSFSFAAEHYVRQGASGNGSGSDWINSFTSLPQTLVRGDTYYIADGSYSGYTFDDPTSGTAHITIKKATQSVHGINSGWNSTYGDGQAVWGPIIISSSYIIFDGATGGGPNSWQSNFGFKILANSWCGAKGITSNGASATHVSIKHLEIEGFGPDGDCSGGRNDLVYMIGGTSDWLFSYVYFYNSGGTMFLWRNVSNTAIEYSYFFLNESCPAEHAEGISHQYGGDITVRYSIWEDIEGTGVIGFADGSNYTFYGNVFFHSSSYPRTGQGGGVSNGTIFNWSSRGATNSLTAHNNTFVDIHGNSGVSLPGGGSGTAYNNYFRCSGNTTQVASASVTRDYSACYGCGSMLNDTNLQVLSSDLLTDSDNVDFTLTFSTDDGIELSVPYNEDIDGNIRGDDGVWDIGAFEYSGDVPFNPRKLSIVK